LTFDDAYQDFTEHAWPILRRHNLPATLFVPTAFPDQPRQFWWDRLQQALLSAAPAGYIETPPGRLPLSSPSEIAAARRKLKVHIKSLPHAAAMGFVDRLCASTPPTTEVNSVLGWSELRRLSEEGVTLAPHSRTHPLMTRVSTEQFQHEAIGSLHDLHREIGPQVPAVFAYPSGACDYQSADALRASGFRAAFTTQRGVNRLGKLDPFHLRRINIGRGTSLPLMRAQLASCASWLTGRAV
jgi:peptidoglycan/xylan/chitin deacetylase (PgdA/CDA1 family)